MSVVDADINEELHVGSASDPNDDGDDVPSPLATVTLPAAAQLPRRLRRARNTFPCAEEVRRCDKYAAVIDAWRTEGQPKVIRYTYAELCWNERG